MRIGKQASIVRGGGRVWIDYPRARDAFEAYLCSLELRETEVVLMPNYIGYSPREGSGVFDPIVNSGVTCKFYELDKSLTICLDSIRHCIENFDVKLIVVIHYFGYIDPAYERVVELAKRNDIKILEDQAHSLFTDIHGGVSGRLSDASIYSLHKMLPVSSGGALSLQKAEDGYAPSLVSKLCIEYDIASLVKTRIRNHGYLTRRLAGHGSVLEVLRPVLEPGIVPQTFPILIISYDRNALYQKMNDSGFGVVSLYHTMISEIQANAAFQTNYVAERILNLPLHQDADEESLDLMCETLLNLLYAN
ncbi:DegT/DnrJ/EryC1/StrS family aminotransferase [Pseudomonas sp. URMO17WK12:I2]|uniref:DegT/DnrJ/EryC1/StrS family aminotransferase n=1 Tax=Pseudomonas sp. URMO17WK12:I2 TaxID=1261623 RepID=UPI000DACC2EA|nr:DegT/DnrJ/EryC1/StrS family aminotransferase [Pseudomonas sp. URMO17WK12:I2]PZW43413.1 dTDP-4-amino-4,6-dideoxygalactose transaminase [Pseudomonas sp. URMO17WK12:I2]